MISRFRALSPKAKDKPIYFRGALNIKTAQSEYVGAQGFPSDPTIKKYESEQGNMGELEKLGIPYAVLVPNPECTIALGDQPESIRKFAKEFSQ